MRTTLDIDDRLMQNLLRVTHTHIKTRAVEMALSDFLRRRQIEELRKLRGKLPLRTDWRKMERLELRELRHSRG